MDEALYILSASIARNPDAFPLVSGFNGIHIAKTVSYSKGGIDVPPLRLWFRKIDENVIELLSIEAYEKQND